jgi:hypothetical protein
MRLLSVIIVAMTSVLLFQGVALAHTSGYDRAQVHHKTSKSPEGEAAPSTHPGECRRPTVDMPSAVMADVPPGVDKPDPASDWNGRDNWDSNDDCCGVACHAAVEGKGDDRLASPPPMSPVALSGMSELLGTRQGRLERPPRRF